MQTAEAINMDRGSAALSALFHRGAIKRTYKAALYLRLSRDDNNGGSESMSIQSQKEMLLSYAGDQGFAVEEIYIDDGWSGTTFERPSWKRMINDIKLGRINMVITKDLSRLGRNYVLTGQYTDFFFPDNGVRYIAVNDGYDTEKEDNDIAPFKNILNEMYAKDISKKIRSSRKVAARQGKFMGSIPPYGYTRSPIDKHKLIVDPHSSKLVKRIFELFKNHESARHIADLFNSEGIPTPMNYYYQSIGQENPYKKNANTWCSGTVISILRNEVYLGRMVQSKRAVKSFKTKKVQELPPELWVVVENTHEAIISSEDWAAVQLLRSTNRHAKPKKTAENDVSLFSNILRCKDCNSRLVYSTNERKTFTDHYYRCSRHVQHGGEACSSHRISLDTISAVVLEDIRNNARLAKEDEEAFVNRLFSVSMKEKTDQITQQRKKESAFKERLVELSGLVRKSFEKNVNGLIPDEMLADLLKGYNHEKAQIETALTAVRSGILEIESRTLDISSELENLKRHTEITELNRTIVTSLIQSITVSEGRKTGKEKAYDIEIRYKFQNPFSAGMKAVAP